jgi:hypothetical protein
VKGREKILRSTDDIKSRVTGDITRLNARLLEIACRLDVDARSHPLARTLPGKILVSFYRKAVNTTKGIQALKGRGLIEEAWILLRVLLETHVNFLYFIRNDPKVMCKRYVAASVLDKLKHLRGVNFYEGTSMASLHPRKKWEEAEAEIRADFDAAEFKAMQRNGFSGLAFEGRAKAVGLKTMYEACYRIASRSVHMFDPAETPIYSQFAFQGRAKEKRELLRLRRQQLEYNQNMLLGRLSFIMAEMIKSHLATGQLILLGLGYEKFRNAISGPAKQQHGEQPDPEGTFRIWRE